MDESEKRIVEWLEGLANAEDRPFGLVDEYAARWALTHAADAIRRGEHREKHNDQ